MKKWPKTVTKVISRHPNRYAPVPKRGQTVTETKAAIEAMTKGTQVVGGDWETTRDHRGRPAIRLSNLRFRRK